MALDVRGSLKNTRISRNHLIVFEELISNAIDSYLIRKQSEPNAPPFQATIDLQFYPSSLLEGDFDLQIACSDNGTGLTDEAVEAFITKDTSYKDDLAVSGLGKCKGTGRIQFFHFFNRVSLQSTYQDSSSAWFQRSMRFDGASHLIGRADFNSSETSARDFSTTVVLDGLKDTVLSALKSQGDLKSLFSKDVVRDHLFIKLLQRLIALATKLGDFEIRVVEGTDDPSAKFIEASDLPSPFSHTFETFSERDPATGIELVSKQRVEITQYKIDAAKFRLSRNVVSLCAKHSPVEDISSRYLKGKGSEKVPIDGEFQIILVEGDVLDAAVNEQRDGFLLPLTIPSGDLFDDSKVSRENLFDAIDEPIIRMLGPSNWSRDDVVTAMSREFGISDAMREETDTRIRHGDSARNVVERVLWKYQKKVLDDTAEVFDLKEQIVLLEPDSDDFRAKISDLAWKYTSKLKDLDKANLSQLIVRRSAVIEILQLATTRGLSVQNVAKGERRKDERLIHSIFFPMRKDSAMTDQHDIWLLDEEYQYFDYICSDTPLANIKWADDTPLFEEGIDEELAKLLKKNEDENAAKRPDIALFHKEGSAVIVEFKAPGVSLDDHIGDLMEYAQLLAAKSGGKLKKFSGYLIGDTVNPNRISNLTKFPSGSGYFGTAKIVNHETDRLLGELYTEIVHYSDVVSRARNRLKVYSDRLGVEI